MEFSHKTGLINLPAGYLPWYDAPGRASRGSRTGPDAGHAQSERDVRHGRSARWGSVDR